MCRTPTCWSPLLLLSLLPLCWGTAMASTLNAGALHSLNKRPATPLLRLHVRTLRLNPNAGKRPRYAMRGTRMRLVISN